jgi:alcohol dehydrogenase
MISVHIEGGVASVRNAPRPRRRAGEALIRLIAGGICNTDLELLRGYYGFRGRPGHEFVGEVVAADTASWVGRRVVGEINLGCGGCAWCARGLGRHCPKRTVLGIVRRPGAFAEFLTLPEANLHEVPPGVKTEHAVFAEPLAAACEILDQVKIARGREAAVLGDGKLGLLIAQVLGAHGACVHVYGKHAGKLALAQAAGARSALSGSAPKAAYSITVDATGSATGLSEAIAMTAPRGVVVMKSTVHGEVCFDAARVIVDEITLLGSRCGRFEPALKLLAGGKLRLDAMISDRYRLAEAPRAFARSREKGVLKVLLRA